jgi:N-acetylneuraminic acid mutarotase
MASGMPPGAIVTPFMADAAGHGASAGGRAVVRRGWMIAALAVVLGCDSSGPGKVGPPDGGTGGGPDGGVAVDGGPGSDAGPDAGSIDAGSGGPDGGPSDGGVGGGGFTTIRWSDLAVRTEKTSEAQGALVGGKLYTFGGFDPSKTCCTPTRHAFVYDPATNAWSRLSDLPEGVSHAGTATDGTDIYLVGGFVEDASRTYQIFGTIHVWVYRVASDRYEPMPPLPDLRAAGTLAYLDGKLRFIGGLSAGQAHDTDQHWVLDLAGGATAWTTAAPLPTPRNHLGSAVHGGKIYVIGGQHDHDGTLVTVPDVEVYDPATDGWTRRASMPRARSHITGSTFVFRDRILVLGGEIANAVLVDDVTAYDPATDTWVALTPMPVKRFSGVAAPMLGGFVYTTGDWNDETFLGMPVE